VYRLLSHSLDDPALVRQLEGDILLAFEDEDAIEKYQQAAQMYDSEGRKIEAAALYEHLLTMMKEDAQYRKMVIDLYRDLGIASKVMIHQEKLLKWALDNKNWEEAIHIADQVEGSSDWVRAAELYEQIMFAMLDSSDKSPDTIMNDVAQKAICIWLRAAEQQKLHQFLDKIKVVDENLYNKACKYMDGKK